MNEEGMVMKRKRLVKSRIRPGCRDIYIKMHNELPPEVAEEFRAIGTTKVVCFLDGDELFVYSEYDDKADNSIAQVTAQFVKELEEKCKDIEYGRRHLEKVFEFNA